MSRTLPSPVALRAFEAAARHLSFTRAADELLVTQSAVSHQVKALEDALGVRLFLRLTRQLRLTEAGEQLLTVLRDSYDRIEEVIGGIRTGRGAGPLRVGMTSYFAARWMTRRIGRFSAKHPEIEIHLHLANDPVDFVRVDLDLAVGWGHDAWPGLEAQSLIPARIIAVCSPSVIDEGMPLDSVNNLSDHTVLHEIDHSLWREWLTRFGDGDVRPGSNLVMDDPNIVHQAAIEGQGVALGVEELLEDEIRDGRLVPLFGRAIELEGHYFLVHPPGARSKPNVRAFCDWLLLEARGNDADGSMKEPSA